MIGNDQLAREHALDHEQSDVAAARTPEAGHVPGTHAEAMGPYDERALFMRTETGGYGAVRWESVLLLVVATAVGWGLVIDTTGAGKGLSWLGYLLDPFGLGGKDGNWAYANLGVLVALLLSFAVYWFGQRAAVQRQETVDAR